MYINEKFSVSLLEPKRMQVFPLKLQYQKVSSYLFKKKSVEAYWTLSCGQPNEPKKYWKTSSNINKSLSKYTYIYYPFKTLDIKFRESWA